MGFLFVTFCIGHIFLHLFQVVIFDTICFDICKTSSYINICIESESVSPSTVMAQNMEYFWRYRNSQLRCDVTLTSRINRFCKNLLTDYHKVLLKICVHDVRVQCTV